MLKADGFDEAIIGIARTCGRDDVIAYDANKCIQILVNDHNMSDEEAVEYFTFNVEGCYVGEGTPVFVWEADITEFEYVE